MSDGLATAVVALLAVLSLIAAGVYLWINRPQYTAHDDTPRVQPLFTGEQSGFVSRGYDAAYEPADDDAPSQPVARVTATPASVDTVQRPAAESEPNIGRFAPPEPAPSLDSAPGAPDVDPNVHASANADEDVTDMRGSRHAKIFSFETPAPRDAATARPSNAPRQPAELVDVVQPFRTPVGSDSPLAPSAGPVSTRAAVPITSPATSPVLRFAVPTDGTLQFLPGRLESTGGDVRRDIRFVRVPGEPVTEVTFGRSEGTPYRHVQLDDATVSRMHARMRFDGGSWRMINLSATNPVVLNGALLDPGTEHLLHEEDVIEMGEIVFRFHGK